MGNIMQTIEDLEKTFGEHIDAATINTLIHAEFFRKTVPTPYPFTHLHQGEVYFLVPYNVFKHAKTQADIEKTDFYKQMTETFERSPYNFNIRANSTPAVFVRADQGRPCDFSKRDLIRITPNYLAFNPSSAQQLKHYEGRYGLINLEKAISQDIFLETIMRIHSVNRYD
nr:hypothetical protein [Nanoarchaeum sp.]